MGVINRRLSNIFMKGSCFNVVCLLLEILSKQMCVCFLQRGLHHVSSDTICFICLFFLFVSYDGNISLINKFLTQLFVYLTINELSNSLSDLFIQLFNYIFIYDYNFISIRIVTDCSLFIVTNLPVCLFIYLSVNQLIHLLTYFIYLFVYIFIYNYIFIRFHIVIDCSKLRI